MVSIKQAASLGSHFTLMSASEMAEQGQGTKRTTEERAKKYREQSAFAQNAFFIFNKAVELVSEYGIEGVDLLNQMLHSILFLGNINATPYSPDDIFAEKEIYLKTFTDFPQPFDRYREDVALRTPFSYFLELIVRCFGENKEMVKAKLCEKLQGCKKSGPLISSVICICQVSNRMYYGGSLTCPGEIERQIMTAVSCLYVWHPYVSSAVLGVFPEDTTKPRFPDGAIKLPTSVECRAYDTDNLSMVKPPCKRCHELYSLPNPRGRRHYPGNCAETEAISRLLKYEERVEKETKMKGVVLGRDEIEERMRSHFDRQMSKKNLSNYNIRRIYVYTSVRKFQS